MTTLREAATQALEALEGGADSWQLVGPAIDALRAALAEKALHIDTLRMAREVFDVETDNRGRETFSGDNYGVERFAALVAAAERDRIAAEWDWHMYGDTEDIDIGAAIRARSNV